MDQRHRRRLQALKAYLGLSESSVKKLLAGSAAYGGLATAKLASPLAVVPFIVGTLVQGHESIRDRELDRRINRISTVAMAYVFAAGRPDIDRLLGDFIAGEFNDDPTPSTILFDALLGLCNDNDYEIKRRIAEAVPFLADVSPDEALRLIQGLRTDWDPIKWHDDNRRRVVEAILVEPAFSDRPLAARADPEVLLSILEYRAGDQVVTSMAVIEALAYLDANGVGTTAALESFLLDAIEEIPQQEGEGLQRLAKLLEEAPYLSKSETEQEVLSMLRDINEFVRIAGARSILRIGKDSQIISIIEEVLESELVRNVRRPMARERVVRYLIQRLDNRAVAHDAESALLRLLHDEDVIIRRAVFDFMPVLIRRHPLKFRIALDAFREDPDADLRERAAVLLGRL